MNIIGDSLANEIAQIFEVTLEGCWRFQGVGTVGRASRRFAHEKHHQDGTQNAEGRRDLWKWHDIGSSGSWCTFKDRVA